MPREQSDLGTPATKPYLCHRCRRSFRRAEHLQRHVRTHTNERPFTCTCGLAFTRRDLLRRHEKLSHSEATLGEHGQEHMPSEAPSVVDDSSLPRSHRPHHQDEHARGLPDGTDGLQQSSHAPIHVESARLWADPTQHFRPVNGREHIYRPIQTIECGDEPSQQVEQGASQDHIIPSDGVEIDIPLNHLYSESSQLQSFTEFADSLGLPFEWASFDLYPPDSCVQNVGNNVQAEPSILPRPNKGPEQRSGSPFRPWLPTVQLGNRIHDTEVRHDTSSQGLFTMSAAGRAKMEAHLSAFQTAIPDFKLPSRHTLTRYFISFFEGFHTHLPFVHIPTFQTDDCYPEFLLAMATLGAQYRFEHQNAECLFWAAKAIVLERIRRREKEFSTSIKSAKTAGNVDPNPSYVSPPTEFRTGESDMIGQTQVIKTILLLLGFASWDPHPEILHEAIGFQSLLVRCLRTAGLNTDNAMASPLVTWNEWAERESDRRTKLLAYTFLNVHSIAYNTPPVLFSSELFMRLPCSTAEWNAEDAASWRNARRHNAVPQLKFQDALALLLKSGSSEAVLQPLLSPLGNYIILHGLFQRIYLVRELSLPLTISEATLPSKELDRLETALHSWTTSWKLTPESSLDPLNKNGPIPFTSSSLLGLAYVRLHLNLGPHRLLETRSPPHIANAIFNAPYPQRHSRLIPALMYSVHALSIPVRLGVDYVARSQAQFWSVRHALASFECCILLTKWLCLLGVSEIPGDLSESEALVLNWVRRVVDEAWSSMDREDEFQSSSPSPVELGLAVVGIWARMFNRNVQWRFINMMGLSLELYFKKVQAEALAGSASEIEQAHSDHVSSL